MKHEQKQKPTNKTKHHNITKSLTEHIKKNTRTETKELKILLTRQLISLTKTFHFLFTPNARLYIYKVSRTIQNFNNKKVIKI